MLDSMIEVHKWGIEVTNFVQISLEDVGGFFIWISTFFDPRHTYLIFFPLLFPFNRTAGIQALWTAATSEWLNHVYKWILFGERPYWWVHTHSELWSNQPPVIKQFSITCETGPGSPSGHVMITSSVLFVFVRGFLDACNENRSKLSTTSIIAWFTYAFIVICIAISRVYIAAHFPHQCLAGLGCGVIIGYMSYRPYSVSRLNLKVNFIMALGTFAVAMTTYYIILGLGIDPNWTLPLAKEFCAHAEWIHLNTTPFFMMARYTGTLLGIGLASRCVHISQFIVISRGSLIGKAVLALISVFVALTCQNLILTSSSTTLVYLSAFVVHMIIPILIVTIVSWISIKFLIF